MPIAGIEELLRRETYPAMTPVESAIARAWLRHNQAIYDTVVFNVRVGEGQDVGEELDPDVRDLARAVTQKRVDLVAWRGPQPTLVEIKPRIGLGALGQLLGYASLWRRTYDGDPQPVLIAVGNTVVSEIGAVLAEYGIRVELFPLEISPF